jgi:hypothetical protein
MSSFYIPIENTGRYTLKFTHTISKAPDLYPYDGSEEVGEYLVEVSKLTVKSTEYYFCEQEIIIAVLTRDMK